MAPDTTIPLLPGGLWRSKGTKGHSPKTVKVVKVTSAWRVKFAETRHRRGVGDGQTRTLSEAAFRAQHTLVRQAQAPASPVDQELDALTAQQARLNRQGEPTTLLERLKVDQDDLIAPVAHPRSAIHPDLVEEALEALKAQPLVGEPGTAAELPGEAAGIGAESRDEDVVGPGPEQAAGEASQPTPNGVAAAAAAGSIPLQTSKQEAAAATPVAAGADAMATFRAAGDAALAELERQVAEKRAAIQALEAEVEALLVQEEKISAALEVVTAAPATAGRTRPRQGARRGPGR